MKDKRVLSHSQNFIKHRLLVQELLGLANINSSDLVIEIGPGKGIITTELIKVAGKVIAIENDPNLVRELIKNVNCGKLEIIDGDFMQWTLPNEQYKVFSNIPFNYTADIVNKLTRSDRLPDEMFLIMQEAAAHRFIGAPFTKNSLTSILIAIDFIVCILRNIERKNFTPKPNVDISFVYFQKREKSYLEIARISENERAAFRDFIVYGYTQWAPNVLKAFEDIFSRKQISILSRTQKLHNLKPTDLNIDQWTNLYKSFSKYASPDKRQVILGSEQKLIKQQGKLEKVHRTRN